MNMKKYLPLLITSMLLFSSVAWATNYSTVGANTGSYCPVTGLAFADLPTSTANTLMGFNSSGVSSDVTLGGGLSLSSGVLSVSAGGGNVTGPGSSTDTALARFSGTGGTTIQNGVMTEDGSGNLAAVGTIASAAQTITSSSANALAVGQGGTTNPALLVNANTASSATGWQVTSAAAAGGVNLAVISSGTNETGTITAKGTGDLDMTTGASGGTVRLQSNGSNRLSVSSSAFTFAPSTSSTANVPRFSYASAADTTLTASTEANEFYLNLGSTRTHSTGALTLQRDFRITGTTHAFVGSSTVTDAATIGIDGAPLGGTNATITNAHGLYIPTEVLTNTTNGDAISVAAPSGGSTSNYAIRATGPSLMDGLISGGTKFTISGCSAGTTVGGATAGKFASGTTGACTIVITMNGATGMTAPNGWACNASDQTTPANLISQSASTTTTATVTGTTVSGDTISFHCMGY